MNRALQFRQRLTVAGMCVLCLLFLAFYFALWSAAQTDEMNHWVTHTEEVLGIIAHARLDRARLENDAWEYHETHDPAVQKQFQEDRSKLKEAMRQAQRLTADNPSQQILLGQLTPVISTYETSLETSFQKDAPARTGDLHGTPASILQGSVNEQVRQLFDKVENNERTLLASRTEAVSARTRQTRYVMVLSGLLAFTILIAAGHLIQREIMTRGRTENGLHTAQELLGMKYDKQSAELGGMMRDLHAQIRARRKAEGELKGLNEELEAHVQLRTAELQETNRELEAFTYSVSHDLRAPLRHLDGFSRMLQQECSAGVPSEALHYADRIRAAATQMTELVEDLLHLSRVGRRVPQRDRISLRAMVEEVREDAMEEAGGREISWKIQPLREVEGDRILIRQVLINLFSNAVKFTRQVPQAEIEIGSREEGSETLFFVRDNGAGFDPRFAGKLFGVFQRLHRQDEFEGTGIGLAIVQRIVQKHGGRVWAESSPGQGATFYFTLPPRKKETQSMEECIGASA